jgi:hypothetical protein
MLVALQRVAVPALVPLNVTVLLVPWLDPKLAPLMITAVPTTPEVGFRLLIEGAAAVTVKTTPLLTTPPTVTTTLPVVAPFGTFATMLVAVQRLAVPALTPLNVTVLLVPWLDPKLAPLIMIWLPAAPEGADKVLIDGGVAAKAFSIAMTRPPRRIYSLESPVDTISGAGLLAIEFTCTTILPVVAPAGTDSTMAELLHEIAVAEIPFTVTVLAPCTDPKFVPDTVTAAPTVAVVGATLEMPGSNAEVTVKPCWEVPEMPLTTTVTGPLVAPVGTTAMIAVELQLLTAAGVPLNVTCPLAPKLVPLIVTAVPTAPEVGFRLLIEGAAAVTVKVTPLLATPLTVTTTLPVVAPPGTVTVMLVALQLLTAAGVPLNVTCPLAPKLVPLIVTAVPTAPEVGFRLLIEGAAAVTVKVTPLLATPLTVTTTLPVVAPPGTVTVMLVALQLLTVAGVPLNVTVLVP